MNHDNKLSVAIITYNEQEVIARCLASVSFADEVVVVDSESSDDTLAIAERLGARTMIRPMSGFGSQKQFAVDQCSNPWVLILDADEVVTEAAAAEIREVLLQPEAKAYTISRYNFFNNKRIRYGSWGSDTVLRLFDKREFRVSDRKVHEDLIGEGRRDRLSNPIYHYPRRNLSSFLEKANRYSSLGAGLSSRKVSVATAFGHAMWTFTFNYFVRLGFIDGSEGLLIAFSDMVDTFFKYAKRWELQQKTHNLDRGL